LSYTANTFGFDNTDGESPQSGYVFWSVASAYAAAVFVIIPIDDVMAAVFDTPVAAIGGKHLLWIGLVRRSACDAVCNFTGILSAFFIGGLPLDEESLSNVRKVEIVVEFVCDPYFASFDPAVIRGIALDKIRILPIFEIERDVFKKTGLVVLDGEVVMSVTIPNQIIGNFSLGQQSICGNFLALNIDGIK